MRFESEIEHHEFSCGSCNYVWHVAFEVDDRGATRRDERHYRYLTGIPASAPQQGRRCPNCWEPTFSSHRIDVSASDGRHQLRTRVHSS